MSGPEEPIDSRFGTTTPLPQRSGRTQPLSLVVVTSEGVASHSLGAAVTVAIGRSDDVDVLIDDPSISRHHALLHLGERLRIEDLGSSNGTRLRDVDLRPNQPVEVSVGEVIELGDVTLFVQRKVLVARRRRLWSHGYFEGRLEEECVRARHSRTSLAVARLRVGESSPQVEPLIASALGPLDVIAVYGPGELELLLPESSPHEAGQLIARMVSECAERGVAVRVGIACFPDDGRSPEELIAAAGARMGGSTDSETTELIVEDAAMLRLYELVGRVATSPISVLLLGETGVGKEVVAREIHDRSPRAAEPMLTLNCGALSESLLESELFGYEKGAFTGADRSKPGLLETADGGTVFLDEIGELPQPLQVKLLRVIEQREVMRVGGLGPRSVDVRFIAATNRDLDHDVETGRFRKDLYFRLNGISLVIPPLRERTAEIERMAKSFVARACAAQGLDAPVLSKRAIAWLESYSWPGNIRELRNAMERAVILCTDGLISTEHLSVEKMGTTIDHAGHAVATIRDELLAALDEDERQRIIDALDQTGGNQSRAAKLLGVSRTTLIARLDAYDIPRPRKRQNKAEQ